MVGANDGSIIIDVLLNTNQLDRNIRVTEQETKSMFGKMGDSVKGFGKALAVGAAAIAGLGVAVVALAKPFVEAAGAAQALNAQFSTVFGDMEKQATESLNKIAKDTSIMPERLKGAFVQMAAFAKTSGVDVAGSLDIASRATIAAADSAAFYDKSIEDVTESLQSYLKGNFENDAALGISSTETTRNAAANKLYSKSFKDLSESQKQLTLLQMVEDGNKLAGALGQAAREADGYENVVGNLGQAWENLKVTIGNLFFDQAIGGLKALTKAIQGIDVNGIMDRLKSIWSAFTEFISPITEIAMGVIEQIIAYWEENGEVLVENITTTLTAIWEKITEVLTFVMEIVGSTLQLIIELWQTNGETIMNTVSTIFGWIKEYIMPIVQEVADFIGQMLAKIVKFFQDDGQQIFDAVSNVATVVMAAIAVLMPAITWIIEYALENIMKVVDGALNIIMGVVKIFSGLLTGDFSKMWEGIKQVFFGAIDLLVGFFNLSFFGGIKKILFNLVESAVGFIKSMWTTIVDLFMTFVKSPVTYIAGMVIEILDLFSGFVIDGVKFITDLATDIIGAVADLPGKFLEIGKDIGKGIIDGIKELNPVTIVGDIAKDMVKKAKGALKIFSPSRVFRGIGKDTMLGWQLGLEDEADKTKDTLIDSMGFEDVVKNGVDMVNLVSGMNGYGAGYSIGVGGLLTPTSVSGVAASSNVITNNNGNTSSIIVNGNTDAQELERMQRRMAFGF